MPNPEILPYAQDRRDDVLSLTLRAWRPVLDRTATEVPAFAFEAFYPSGWETRQTADVAAMLEDADTATWLACQADTLVGFLGLRLHPEDNMGEVHIIAVDPDWQGQGIGQRLMRFADDQIRAAGLAMVMVETIGDTGHAPARRLYEAAGYQPWPVARYFKKL